MTRQIRFGCAALNSGSPYTTTAPNTTVAVKAINFASLLSECLEGEEVRPIELNYKFNFFSLTIDYSVLPICLQTSGTVSDTVMATENDLEVICANCCTEDFGYEVLSTHKLARRDIVDPTAPTMNSVLQISVTIPKNIISVLRRIAREGENRDNMYLVLILQTSDINNIGIGKSWLEKYDIIRQTIKIR